MGFVTPVLVGCGIVNPLEKGIYESHCEAEGCGNLLKSLKIASALTLLAMTTQYFYTPHQLGTMVAKYMLLNGGNMKINGWMGNQLKFEIVVAM